MSARCTPGYVCRLKLEIDDLIGQKGYITSDDITKLPFMTSLIKETLRMYPPVGQIARDILKPIEVDGMVLPADSTILVCLEFTQHDPR